MNHVCMVCVKHNVIQLTDSLTHGEWKRHIYLQHGQWDGDPNDKCGGDDRCAGLYWKSVVVKEGK